MSKNVKRTAGRPSALTTRFIADLLGKIDSHSYFDASYYLLDKIVERGYLLRDDIKTGSRGRPQKSYALTAKGRNLLRLSKNWYVAA